MERSRIYGALSGKLTVGILDVGCILDRSHCSAYHLDQDIIEYAERLGFTYEPIDLRGEDHYETMRWEADRAVEWLNDNVASDDVVFTVDDNSLYLEHAETD